MGLGFPDGCLMLEVFRGFVESGGGGGGVGWAFCERDVHAGSIWIIWEGLF